MMDYYELLGVPRSASDEDIHRAFRRLARRYHPDVSAGADADARFQALSDAYEVLHDRQRRAHYDRSLPAITEVGGPPRAAAAARPQPSVRAPYFSEPRRSTAVPRFIGEQVALAPRILGLRPTVHVRISVRWLA